MRVVTTGAVLAALFFLFSLESRMKRAKILHGIDELRAVSHVIDMHQLTKDPSQTVSAGGKRTKSSPERTLTPFQLARYLDYCSELLSLIGKLAAEGRTIVLATHFLGEAGRLATTMAVLHRGKLRAFGRPADLAADLWAGIRAEVDLSRRAGPDVTNLAGSITGVRSVVPVDGGMLVEIADREVLPRLVESLVRAGHQVYGCTARTASLEDVYFAIESAILAEELAAGGAVQASVLDAMPVARSGGGEDGLGATYLPTGPTDPVALLERFDAGQQERAAGHP